MGPDADSRLRRPLRVAVLQSACAGAGEPELLAALERALAPPVDLLVCPELFLGGYGAGALIPQLARAADNPFAAQAAALARRHGTALAYGYAERATGLSYNAAAVIGADGAVIANHRKRCLPNPYEKAWFQTGSGLTCFALHGWKVAVAICYEAEFPETVRAAALAGADLVIVPTALSARWPIVARAVIPTRAFENGLFIAYANHAGTHGDLTYLGESCIVGPDGQDLARAGAGPEVIRATLQPGAIAQARGKIAYLADSRGL